MQSNNKQMTSKQRMLAAYRGLEVDTVPVAPEFWYYVPAKLLGVDMVTFEREVQLWEALHKTFKHYNTDGWGIVFPKIETPNAQTTENWIDLGDGKFESRQLIKTPYGELTSSQHYDKDEPSWLVERPIKDFNRDWPAHREATMGAVEEADWSGVQKALDTVGDDYLLEVFIGGPFFDYIAGGREGGLQQGIFDLMENEDFFIALQEIYIDYMRRLTRETFKHTSAESICIGCSWSCVSLIGPNLWRRWDKPVIRAVADEAHALGKLLHIHYHGKCHAVLSDLADCGADCICPFERPPGGDITDLSEVKRILDGKVTVNGNVHTVETLIRGTENDVRREVEEIFEKWGPDKRRLILGTGDQVGRETPEENIIAMIETGRRLGRWSI